MIVTDYICYVSEMCPININNTLYDDFLSIQKT